MGGRTASCSGLATGAVPPLGTQSGASQLCENTHTHSSGLYPLFSLRGHLCGPVEGASISSVLSPPPAPLRCGAWPPMPPGSPGLGAFCLKLLPASGLLQNHSLLVFFLLTQPCFVLCSAPRRAFPQASSCPSVPTPPASVAPPDGTGTLWVHLGFPGHTWLRNSRRRPTSVQASPCGPAHRAPFSSSLSSGPRLPLLGPASPPGPCRRGLRRRPAASLLRLACAGHGHPPYPAPLHPLARPSLTLPLQPGPPYHQASTFRAQVRLSRDACTPRCFLPRGPGSGSQSGSPASGTSPAWELVRNAGPP